MLTAHELYLAVRPQGGLGLLRALDIQPSGHDCRIYLRESNAWKWLDYFAPNKPAHPGYVLELHLDQLFERERDRTQSPERRFAFHERMFQNHAAWAAAYQDDRSSALLDENDIQVLRRVAETWLATKDHTKHDASYPVEQGLASVLRALINSGKLGGGR